MKPPRRLASSAFRPLIWPPCVLCCGGSPKRSFWGVSGWYGGGDAACHGGEEVREPANRCVVRAQGHVTSVFPFPQVLRDILDHSTVAELIDELVAIVGFR